MNNNTPVDTTNEQLVRSNEKLVTQLKQSFKVILDLKEIVSDLLAQNDISIDVDIKENKVASYDEFLISQQPQPLSASACYDDIINNYEEYVDQIKVKFSKLTPVEQDNDIKQTIDLLQSQWQSKQYHGVE